MSNNYSELIDELNFLLEHNDLLPAQELINTIDFNKIPDKKVIFEFNLCKNMLLNKKRITKANIEVNNHILRDLNKNTDNMNRFRALLLRFEIYLTLNMIDDLKQLVEDLNKISNMIKIDIIKIATRRSFYKQLGSYYIRIGNPSHAKTNLEKALEITSPEYEKDYSEIISNLGVSHFRLGEMDKAIVFFKIFQSFHLKLGNMKQYSRALSNLGSVYNNIGNLDEAIIHYKKAYEIIKDLESDFELAQIKFNLGNVFWSKGALTNSEFQYKSALLDFKTLNRKPQIARCLNGLGNINWLRGELEIALNYYKESLSLRLSIGNILDIGESYNNIGMILSQKNDLKNALDHLIKALGYFKEGKNAILIATNLYAIISLFLDMNEKNQARNYLKELKEYNNSSNNDYISLYFLMAKGLVLKLGNEIPKDFTFVSIRDILSNLINSKNIFKSIVERKVIDFEITASALINLTELLINELKIIGSTGILGEITIYVNEINALAEKNDSFTLLAKTLLLQSKLAIFKNDVVSALSYLSEAEKVTEEKELKMLNGIIAKEKEMVSRISDNQLDSKILDEDSSIYERLEHTNLHDVIVLFRQDRIEHYYSKESINPMKFDEFSSFMEELFSRANS